MMGDLTVNFTIKIAPSVPADIGLSLDLERRETLILSRNVADIRLRGTTSTKWNFRASRLRVLFGQLVTVPPPTFFRGVFAENSTFSVKKVGVP